MTTQLVKAWSYSRYADHSRCPLFFVEKYIRKSIPEHTSPAMQRGTDIHKSAADWLSGKAEGLMREAYQNPRAEQIFLELGQMPKDWMAVEQQWGFTHNFKPCGWFDRGGVVTWFRNICDVAVVYPDVTAEAIDWKTGKRYAANTDQMETQALAVLCQYPAVKHVTTRMVYLDEKGKDIEDIEEFPATHKQRLIDKWTKKVEPMFTDKVFAPRPNDKCRFCPLAKSAGGKCAFG